MSNFVKFEPSTGRILFSGSVPDSMLSAQGDNVLEGIGSSETHYVEGCALVEKPDRPSAHHQFDYTSKTWVLDADAAWAWVRSERTRRLADSDWTQLPDVPATLKAHWANYRQALRDVTSQIDPLNIAWPVSPSN